MSANKPPTYVYVNQIKIRQKHCQKIEILDNYPSSGLLLKSK